MYTVNIYGTANSTKPDITCRFDISSSMYNGKWTYSACSISYNFHNELISELNSETVKAEIVKKITEILNSNSGKSWIVSPKFRLYYDTDTGKPVIQ